MSGHQRWLVQVAAPALEARPGADGKPAHRDLVRFAAIMACMLSLKMNDAAVTALGVLDGLAGIAPPGGLAPGLRDLAARGIVRRGRVLTWAGSARDADGAPASFQDLTGWECFDSSFHLDDLVPVDVAIVDGEPVISDADELVLLRQGLAFALEFSRAVNALWPRSPVRCIVASNVGGATFRFHQIRPGEDWTSGDLDQYEMEKVIVLDIEPAAT